jgi:hypothetical protein
LFYPYWAYQYTIGVSENGTDFTTVVDQTGNTTPYETTDTFSAQGRYVRITIVAGNPDGAAMAREFKVYAGANLPRSVRVERRTITSICLPWDCAAGSGQESHYDTCTTPGGIRHPHRITTAAWRCGGRWWAGWGSNPRPSV